MSNINAIIIDDEPQCIELLTLMLKSQHPDVCILETGNSMATGLKLIEDHKERLHLLFLDIQMQ